jgi:dethiobiotin synthetase
MSNKKVVKLFVAATGQHVGKTTTCLGMLTGLRKHLPNSNVNYIKPVGQQHVIVDGVKVDKDVVLFKKWFKLTSREADMSPVVVAAGYTREHIDGKHRRNDLAELIDKAMVEVSRDSDVIVVEGTGHTGVGKLLSMRLILISPTLWCLCLIVHVCI